VVPRTARRVRIMMVPVEDSDQVIGRVERDRVRVGF
jgi:hypothetical protein